LATEKGGGGGSQRKKTPPNHRRTTGEIKKKAHVSDFQGVEATNPTEKTREAKNWNNGKTHHQRKKSRVASESKNQRKQWIFARRFIKQGRGEVHLDWEEERLTNARNGNPPTRGRRRKGKNT